MLLSNIVDEYFLLEIDFASKKFFYKNIGMSTKPNKYSYKGKAYYLVNKKSFEVHYETSRFESFEYRPMDDDFLHSKKKKKQGKDEPTDCYLNLLKKGFDREKTLPRSKLEVEIANKKQIAEVNEFVYRNIDTVLDSEKVVTGSNPSGSEAEYSRTPIYMCNDELSEYKIFINAIKRIRNQKSNIKRLIRSHFCKIENFIEFSKGMEKISFQTLMDQNEFFRNSINFMNDLEDGSNNLVVSREMLMEVKRESKNNLDEKIRLCMYELKNRTLPWNKFECKMRNIFRKKLMIEANKLDLIDYVESEILELEDTIACHLYEVKNVNIDSSDDELNSIADVNNGLLLSSTLHDIFDKYKITFETSGRLKSNSEIYKKKYKGLKIAEKALNKKRQMYIQKRNEVTNLK